MLVVRFRLSYWKLVESPERAPTLDKEAKRDIINIERALPVDG